MQGNQLCIHQILGKRPQGESFMQFNSFIRSIAYVAALACAGANAADVGIVPITASVYLVADGGSWVGGAIGGTEVTWTQGVTGQFVGWPNYGSYDNGIDIRYNDGNSWDFQFAGPGPLHLGMYLDARRFPFNGPDNPGISIYGNGRGNNQQSGWFNVLELSYSPDGNLNSFAVDFKQYDESLTSSGPGLYGSLRFNSNISITAAPVPEPEAALLAIIGLATVLGLTRSKRESSQA